MTARPLPPWRAGVDNDAGGIYAQDGSLIGIMLDPHDADMVVETVNRLTALLREIEGQP